MASMRQNIARALIKTRIGLTTSELSDDLQLKPAVIGMDLAKMAIEGTAQKGEYLEGEGQLWIITEKGVETYATKEGLEVKNNAQVEIESPLTQTEKTVIQSEQAAPIIEENVLEQIVNDGLEKFADMKYADDSIARGMCSVKSVSEVGSIDVKNTVPSDVALNPELFELVKVIDEKNAAIFELFNRKPKQIILNRENKINELHKLCGSGILSNGTVTILNDIIGDLQVE